MKVCECPESDLEPLDSTTQAVRCKTCGGLSAYRLWRVEDLDALAAEMGSYGGTD